MNGTTLQLTVERFRAIASADIRLDEITVLAGINASGKSTLAHLFHSLINLNAIYPTSLESYYWEKLSRTVDATEELKWQIDHPGEIRSAAARYRPSRWTAARQKTSPPWNYKFYAGT